MRALERVLAVAMYGAAAAMTGVALLRSVDAEFHHTAILVTALTPLLLAPAWLVLGYALGDRRPFLGAICVGLVVAQLAWVGGDYALAEPRELAAGEVALKIATANVLQDNRDPVALVESLALHDPDVIVLEEMRVPLDRLAHLIEDYPAVTYGDGRRDILIMSRLPVEHLGLVKLGRRELPWMDVVTEAGIVRVVGVHLTAPVGDWRTTAWRHESARAAEVFSELGPNVVVAGDFNATGQHHVIRSLIDAGFRDAHLERGRGLGATWPAGGRAIPVLRLDHIMVGPALDTVSLQRIDLPGSDHRGLLATIAVTTAVGDDPTAA